MRGRATVIEDGLVWLKFTLLNPDVTETQLIRLMELVETAAGSLADARSPLHEKELHHASAA